jgi:CheY-like chemotaxis protein
VEDTGIGISAEQCQRLFQPFTQADPTTCRRYGGTGLGLILSMKLAHALGGDVRLARSTPSEGSCFEITVSLENPRYRLGPMQCSSPVNEPIDLRGTHVLVAEDAPDNQILIRKILTASGAEVSVVENGLEVQNVAKKEHFDLILMDIQMPLLDGYEATKRLRESGSKVPIIALTAHAMVEEAEKCLASGFTDYLSKPINHQTLLATIKKWTRGQPDLLS